jgi:hypothetical protein
MRNFLLLATAAIFLVGCSHSLYLVGRTSGAKGTAQIVTAGNKSGDVEISLAGKIYTGRWVYSPTGGSYSSGTAFATSGPYSATATGSAVSLPMGGNGSILASASDGSALRCVFNYSEWGSTGTGMCQDNQGEVYDLQIS